MMAIKSYYIHFYSELLYLTIVCVVVLNPHCPGSSDYMTVAESKARGCRGGSTSFWKENIFQSHGYLSENCFSKQRLKKDFWKESPLSGMKSIKQCTIVKLKIGVNSSQLLKIIHISLNFSKKCQVFLIPTATPQNWSEKNIERKYFKSGGKIQKTWCACLFKSELVLQNKRGIFLFFKRTIWANVRKYWKNAFKVWKILICKYFH